jgi:hypothetical protein
LVRQKQQTSTTEQILELIRVIINQNYFQYGDKYCKPTKGIAMGSPLSSNMAEIYLQYFKEMMIKHWIETSEIQ